MLQVVMVSSVADEPFRAFCFSANFSAHLLERWHQVGNISVAFGEEKQKSSLGPIVSVQRRDQRFSSSISFAISTQVILLLSRTSVWTCSPRFLGGWLIQLSLGAVFFAAKAVQVLARCNANIQAECPSSGF